MEFRVIQSDLTHVSVPTLLVFAYEDDDRFDPAVRALDKTTGGSLGSLAKTGEISGKFREFFILHLPAAPFTRLIVIGVGKRKKYNVDKYKSMVAKGARIARRMGSDSLAIPVGTHAKLPAFESAEAAVEGFILGLYRFRKYKTEKPKKKETPLEKLTLVAAQSREAKPAEEGARRGKILAEAAAQVRDMVNEPANVMTPGAFAEAAQDVARKHRIKIRIYEKDEIEDLGMGALLGVARGSRQPPKLVVMEYRGGTKESITLGLVGKGVTFDSGGISIKPAEDMHHMTSDMGGAAACLGAIRAIADLRLPIHVTAVLPLAENLPDGNAYKPGDIVTTCSGKTIEVINTDAEGRMLLADALSFITRQSVNAIVDVATLTGAVCVALGTVASGVFSTDEKFLAHLMEASEASHERVWRLPLFEEYSLQVKGALADLKNSAGRYGGACTAAAFLKEFVGEIPWVHVDIAGTARIDADKTLYSQHPYYPKSGATGVGVRLLTFLAERLSKKSAKL